MKNYSASWELLKFRIHGRTPSWYLPYIYSAGVIQKIFCYYRLRFRNQQFQKRMPDLETRLYSQKMLLGTVLQVNRLSLKMTLFSRTRAIISIWIANLPSVCAAEFFPSSTSALKVGWSGWRSGWKCHRMVYLLVY